jgi:RNA polymerase sigma-70 factor, ECF subfamily
LQFQPFDEAYLHRLRARDFRTQEHFCAYFADLIRITASARVKLQQMVEDVRQETFARFFKALDEDKIREPDRLGSYVIGMCKNVLREQYRRLDDRADSIDCEDEQNLPAIEFDVLGSLIAQENKLRVRNALDQLPERDQRVLKAIFFEERDKDEICNDFGVDREYLRVLVCRAKKAFKKLMGDKPPN